MVEQAAEGLGAVTVMPLLTHDRPPVMQYANGSNREVKFASCVFTEKELRGRSRGSWGKYLTHNGQASLWSNPLTSAAPLRSAFVFGL